MRTYVASSEASGISVRVREDWTGPAHVKVSWFNVTDKSSVGGAATVSVDAAAVLELATMIKPRTGDSATMARIQEGVLPLLEKWRDLAARWADCDPNADTTIVDDAADAVCTALSDILESKRAPT